MGELRGLESEDTFCFAAFLEFLKKRKRLGIDRGEVHDLVTILRALFLCVTFSSSFQLVYYFSFFVSCYLIIF